ncbi:AbrB/MazE/SpoVT family DNA-binding domain-containing protein [uncultured Rhodoblastus sp.]|uniref:AbrB/MazE/SpoVT family DNA-binding domain-containing protein n=1 Tax=uncultured Rhodoblastus sp. TaxID=543037 RepID=UPI0025CFE0B9|nr:AbrB/MazE/SpoVT family DNA-binding domain-containing protein [uncultured Rhodoblastus sp.]
MQVAKWGNSLAVRLPKKLVDELGLKPGDEIDIVEAAKEKLAVEKIDRREEALARLAAVNLKLPADYKFDRDEANER